MLVDENDHVDREGAARSGVGFYGKNTMLITRRHGSWVVLGTLVTDAEIERSQPLALDCGSCRLCIDACPTAALDEPGTLDSTRCLSYWSQAPGAIPEEYRAELGAQVYGCDICQDVCPWNRGIEKRREGQAPPPGAEPHVSLVEWLEASDEELRDRYERLYFPRKDPRYLRRNALVAAGNLKTEEHRHALEAHAESGDPLLREHASGLWTASTGSADEPRDRHPQPAVRTAGGGAHIFARVDTSENGLSTASRGAQIEPRTPEMKQEALRRWQLERWISLVRLIAVPWAILEVAFLSDYPSGGYEAAAWVTTAVLAIGAVAFFLVGRRGAPERLQPAICLAGLLFDTGVIWAYALVFTFEPGTPIRELLFFPVVEAALRYGLRGGLLMPAAQAPILLATEWWRSDRFAPPEFTADHVTFPLGLQFAMGGIIGWLVNRLARETAAAQERASEAEALRDRLGHRVDLLDAANRCARALGSSLEIEEAFAASSASCAG